MNQSRFSVAGIGDLVADLMVPINGFPIEADSLQMIDHLEFQPGGMGNFLIAGQRIGLSMLPMDVLGADQYGKMILDVLKDEGVNTSCLNKVGSVHTRVIVVLADGDGKHAFMAYREGGYPTQMLTSRWKKALGKVDALLTVGYSLSEDYICSAILEAMQYVRNQGKIVFFDPGPMVNQIDDHVYQQALRSTDVVLLTEDELELGAGGRDVNAAQKLLDYGVKLVCVKCGAAGCYLVDREQVVKCPGYPVALRDTNGAGDSFAAAFIYGYLDRWPFMEIGSFANVMGAVKVQKFGAGRNVPTLQEIQEMIRAQNISLPHFR